MVWCSGWELASAVSNAGGLGLIGAGSMHPDTLRIHIQKCRHATTKPFGINVPLLYPEAEKLMKVIIEEGVKIVFTSAGNPENWTAYLKENGITVAHVVANKKFALKAQSCGVDAIVAEGFEAGGHNGREEITSMCLIPMIKEITTVPLIAAGGISSGSSMLAAMALGADGVQIGSAFAAAKESSAHDNFKKAILDSAEGDTKLSMKELMPVRLLKNKFYMEVERLELSGARKEELTELLGKGRAKKGMFEGDIDNGELEIGQVAAMITSIKPAAQILAEIWANFKLEKERIAKLDFT